MSCTEIEMLSGRRFDFKNPLTEQINLGDIEIGLSHCARFSGQTVKVYSVAQHSVLCSRVAPEGLEMQALMHDAHEAYTGDIPTPLKAMLPDYRLIERKAEIAVRRAFRLPDDFDPRIKEIDRRMCRTEALHFGFEWANWPEVVAWGEPYEGLDLDPWSSLFSGTRFVMQYKKLIREG